MQISRKALIGLVLGGVLVGTMVSVGAQESTPPPDQPGERQDARPRGHGRAGDMKRSRAMRSESVFPGRDGGPVRTVRTDRGILQSVDGNTLVITEEDGTVVRVPVQDDTRLRRDGEQAGLEDLRQGDHVHAVQVKEGDGDFVTKGVRAISAERYAETEQRRAEMQQRREQCRENPEECRAEMQQRREEHMQRRADRTALRTPGEVIGS